MKIIPRRSFLKGIPATAAGMLGLAWPRPGRADGPGGCDTPGDAEASPAAAGDMTFAIRNWYANRCPLLARLGWFPADEGAQCRPFSRPVPLRPGWPSTSPLPGGIQTPTDFEMTIQLQNLADDIESSFYYGPGASIAGILGYIASRWTRRHGDPGGCWVASNPRTQQRSGVIMDDDPIGRLIAICRAGGGDPDCLVVAADVMARWDEVAKSPVRRVDAGETVFGTPIVCHESDGFPGQAIVEAPLMRAGGILAMESRNVRVLSRLNPCYRPLASHHGEWAACMRIDVREPSHHAYAELARDS